MKKTAVAVLSLVAVLALTTLPVPLDAEEAPQPKRWEGVDWKSVVWISYQAGKRDRALEIVHDHFMPAGKASGMPGPVFLEMTTGEWDVMMIWSLEEGVNALTWERSPQGIAWFQALVEQEGGPEEAQKILDEYMGYVARHSSALGLTRAGAGGGTTARAANTTTLPLTTESAAARAHFARGREALNWNRNDEARAAFDAAIQADRDFALAWLYRAFTAQGASDWRRHVDSARDRMAGASRAEQIQIEMELTNLDNDVEKRLELARRLVETYPDSPEAHRILSGQLDSVKDYTASRESLDRALALDPQYAAAHRDLTYSYLFGEPKNLYSAEQHALRAVEIRPQEAEAWIALGDVYRGGNRLVEALEAYTSATEVDPKSNIAYSKKGHVNTFLGNYVAARNDFQKAAAVASGGTKATWANFGTYTWVYEGNMEKALEANQKVLASIDGMGLSEDQATFPKITTWFNRAQMGIYGGDYELAADALAHRAEYIHQVTDRVGSPDWTRSQEAEIVLWDGMLAAHKGSFRTARQAADRYAALVESERNPRKMEDYHRLLGTIERKRGRYQSALEHYQKANTENVQVKYELALVQEALGNQAEADRLFEEVARFNFNSLGYALIREQAIEKAEGP